MANGKVHTTVGSASGAGRRSTEPATPDVLEPAIHSWHRDICHSWTVGSVLSAGGAKLEEWERHCRVKAAIFRQMRLASREDPVKALFYFLTELFWNLAAGFAVGFAAGYVSHLILDAATPLGLPRFCR
jgi:hypothetical protein